MCWFCVVNIFPSHIASPSPNVLIMFYSACKSSAYLNVFISSKTTASRRQRLGFNPVLALPHVKYLCSAFSKSIGTKNVSKRVSESSERNIKHALCFSTATFKKQDWQQSKLKVYENRQLVLYSISLCLEASSFERVQRKTDCDSSSKQTTPPLYVNKLTSPQILMSKLIPPRLPFAFLRLLLGYKSAVVDVNLTSTGRFLGSPRSDNS